MHRPYEVFGVRQLFAAFLGNQTRRFRINSLVTTVAFVFNRSRYGQNLDSPGYAIATLRTLKINLYCGSTTTIGSPF